MNKLISVPLRSLEITDQSVEDLNREMITSRIVAKENWFKKILDSGLVDFIFRFDVRGYANKRLRRPFLISFEQIQNRNLYADTRSSMEFDVLRHKFFLWIRFEITRHSSRCKKRSICEIAIDRTAFEVSFLTTYGFFIHTGRRILIISIINILLLPFLVIFVALYAIFRYGEEFYKDPGNLTARQWSLAARW